MLHVMEPRIYEKGRSITDPPFIVYDKLFIKLPPSFLQHKRLAATHELAGFVAAFSLGACTFSTFLDDFDLETAILANIDIAFFHVTADRHGILLCFGG